MKVVEIKDWQHFEETLKELYIERERNKDSEYHAGVSEFLFRGQPNTELLTTLERRVVGKKTKKIELCDYYRIISRVKPEIESFTGQRWDIPTYPEFKKEYGLASHVWGNDFLQSREEQNIYSYMAYLRHHGFPSPLLDWTESPYIAAFFAFDKVNKGDESVVVYIYLEYAGFGKSKSSNKPWIHKFGSYVRTHKRHFLQKSQYTVGLRIEDEDVYYIKHDEAFTESESRATGLQDLRWKLIIPSERRGEFLSKLDMMNINAFTLFESEEGLIQKLVEKEMEFK